MGNLNRVVSNIDIAVSRSSHQIRIPLFCCVAFIIRYDSLEEEELTVIPRVLNTLTSLGTFELISLVGVVTSHSEMKNP